ncbi:MAG: lipoyl domain-containing protein [Eubacteriales bacterium]|nr:lipoyl domain-containing protein [Eubacteriales bacterium]
MAKREIRVPRLAPNMESGVIVAWLKEEGEAVEKSDVLYEIETDKVVSSIEADAPGRLAQILTPVGEQVAVDQVVAEIEVD